MKKVLIHSEIADGLADIISQYQREVFDDEEMAECESVYQAILSLVAAPSGTSITVEIK